MRDNMCVHDCGRMRAPDKPVSSAPVRIRRHFHTVVGGMFWLLANGNPLYNYCSNATAQWPQWASVRDCFYGSARICLVNPIDSAGIMLPAGRLSARTTVCGFPVVRAVYTTPRRVPARLPPNAQLFRVQSAGGHRKSYPTNSVRERGKHVACVCVADSLCGFDGALN